jgi:hypothetical protein
MDVVDLVNLYEVLEEHKNDIWEKAGLSAEVRMLKECENLSHECFEVLVMLKDVCGPQGCHVVRNFLHALSQNIGLVGNIEIELYVVGVLLTYLGIHLNIVVHFGLFVLVGMKQVFLALKVLVDFSVDLDVLEGAMEHN